jgi:SRSO17 transposase
MGTESDVEVGLWDAELESLLQRVGGRFGRVEPRRRMRDYVRGLLGPVGRKNSWQIAEYAGHGTPHGLQRLLSWCQWDPEQIRDDLQDYVAERLGQPGGVLIVDDTGFLKKGTVSAGVQRQYSGTAGARISITVSDGFPRGLFGRVAVPLCGRVMRVSA